MKKLLLTGIVMICFSVLRAGELPWPTELKYDFLPAQKITFVKGVVKNNEATAMPDIHAQYSKNVMVDGKMFRLPWELCETMCACYKADLNNDQVPDYVFVNVVVWNGRFCGTSDVAVFVSNPEKSYSQNFFKSFSLDAVKTDGRIMLVKYAHADDEVSLIKQRYTFSKEGLIELHSVAKD